LRDLSNYCNPSQFILTHRHLQTSPRKYRIAMNTFTRDMLINWDTVPDYSHYHGGTSESPAALKKRSRWSISATQESSLATRRVQNGEMSESGQKLHP
jgi:hypothetical protein